MADLAAAGRALPSGSAALSTQIKLVAAGWAVPRGTALLTSFLGVPAPPRRVLRRGSPQAAIATPLRGPLATVTGVYLETDTLEILTTNDGTVVTADIVVITVTGTVSSGTPSSLDFSDPNNSGLIPTL